MGKEKSQFGELPRRYTFFLNPYQDYRFTSCPICEQPAKWRKFPLLIHVEPLTLFALNMHGRFCPDCDLLIVHRDLLEEQLAANMAEHDPSLIGNDYLVFGTVERKAWRENMQNPKLLDEMRKHIADFRGRYIRGPAGRLVFGGVDHAYHVYQPQGEDLHAMPEHDQDRQASVLFCVRSKRQTGD